MHRGDSEGVNKTDRIKRWNRKSLDAKTDDHRENGVTYLDRRDSNLPFSVNRVGRQPKAPQEDHSKGGMNFRTDEDRKKKRQNKVRRR